MTDLRLDPDGQRLFGPKGEAHLFPIEARVMGHLIAHPLGLTVAELVALTWPANAPAEAGTALRVHLYRLRAALAKVTARTVIAVSHPANVYALADAAPN